MTHPTDTKALDALIEAVEAGELLKVNIVLGNWFSLDHSLLWSTVSDINSAFRGSLDAAKALHEALLPGWEWYRWPQGDFEVRNGIGWFQIGQSFDPARAWLLAILKAYRTQVTQ